VKKTTLLILLIIFQSTAQSVQVVRLKEKLPRRPADFYHLKAPGGDEQNSINQFLEDTTGQMWIATKDGLIRYNGKRLFIYKSDPKNPNSIASNFVTKLLLDKAGNLWVATQKGVSRYRPGTDDFENLDPALNGQYITDIQEDAQGVIWLINHVKNRLYAYKPQSGSLSLEIDDNLSDSQGKVQMLWLFIDKRGRIFITDKNKGFVRYFPQNKTFKRYNLIDKATARKYGNNIKSYIAKIIQDKTNPDIFWVGSNLGFLIKYHLKTGKQERLWYQTRLTNHGFHCYNSGLFQDSNDNIWVTTWFYGTFQILPDRKTYIHYLPDPDRKNSISNTINTAVYQDRAGYLWFGNEYQGIDILKKNKKFFVFPTYPHKKDDLPPANYNCIIKAFDRRIWVGAEGGIYSLDPKTLKRIDKTNLFDGAGRFFDLFTDSKNNLWVGTEKGLYCIDDNGKLKYHFTYQKDDAHSLSCNFVSQIKEDKEGNIWIGTFCAGLVKFVPETRKFYRFMPDKSDPKSISHPYVTDIFIDRDNQVWVGTLDGLNKLNKQSGNFTVYKNIKTQAGTIGSSVINDINQSGDTLWVATQGGGLNRFDPKTGKFYTYLKQNGLPGDNVKSIQIDRHGNLWLATTKNIVKFNPANNQMVTYTQSDGLENRLYVENLGWRNLNFKENLTCQDHQGYMYFGGSGGLVFFHPDSLPVNTYQAPLQIEYFKVNGKQIPLNQNQIELKPNQNQLEFSFTLMNLIQAEKNKYAWKLEPYDTIWHYGNYKAKARYYDLPHGRYRLLYKAANNDGIWTRVYPPVFITIKPHFYQTTAFVLLLILIVLLLIVAFVMHKWYLQKQMEKKRKLMRYSWSNLDENKAHQINEKLLKTMEDKNIYLEPDLSLNKLAEIMQVKPNYLSQVINQYHKQNFFEFINTYRIQEAKYLLRETSLKIEAVAYDSGFNSLSTFNSVFKKMTGSTPSKYRKQTD